MYFICEILPFEPTTNSAQGSFVAQTSLKVLYVSYAFIFKDLSS